jgi:hypothetical protein
MRTGSCNQCRLVVDAAAQHDNCCAVRNGRWTGACRRYSASCWSSCTGSSMAARVSHDMTKMSWDVTLVWVWVSPCERY